SQLQGVPVLVVEDNATQRRIIARQLAGLGFKPTVTDSAAAALEEITLAQAKGLMYPLVLIDSRMPDMDGFTLAQRLRERTPHSSLPAPHSLLMMISSADWQTEV